MDNNIDRLFMRLSALPISQAKAAIKKWAVYRVQMGLSVTDALVSGGYEVVATAPTGAAFVDDGGVLRALTWVCGRAYALPVDEIVSRRGKISGDSQKRQPGARPGEALTSVLCPSCKSVMAKAPVCPNCSKGKAGFKILCTCTECNHEVYL